MLTEAVRRRPYSVVLLDEVEKAHPDVMELFYQVFDKGMLEDGEGREIDFKNTIILLTSNVGTDTIMKLCADPETLPGAGGPGRGASGPSCSRRFKPALLGRMIVVPYYPLHGEVLRQHHPAAARPHRQPRGENHGAEMVYDDDARRGASPSRCTEAESGARNVDHILTRTLLPGDLRRDPRPHGEDRGLPPGRGGRRLVPVRFGLRVA